MSSFPNLVLENQFGEVSNNWVKGGSSSIDFSFKADSANANGLGISGLTGAGVKSVYMHTSQTPAVGNPNPATGYIYIQLAANYAAFLALSPGVQSPNSGTPINVTTGVTQGLAYVITSLGTTSAAQWQVLGLPVGVVPAVGASFIGKATTTATGSGQIQVQSSSGVYNDFEVIGDPNQSCNPSDGSGAWILCQIMGPTSTSNPTPIPKAPTDGSIIRLRVSMAAAPVVLEA